MKSRCKLCDAPIFWAKAATGKALPLDSKTSAGGTLVLVRRGEDQIAIGPSDPEYARLVGEGARLRMPHSMTCAKGGQRQGGRNHRDLFTD
jgi:hypothetical protein